MRSTRSGQTFSAPVVMTSSMRPDTTSSSSAIEVPASPVANQFVAPSGPATPPVAALAIAAEEHGCPDQDLPGFTLLAVARVGGGQRSHGDLHTLERPPVVDDTRARLRHAVGGHDVGREVVGRLAPTEEHAGEDGGIEPAQCGRDQSDVADPTGPPGRFDGLGLESRHDHERGPRDDRPGDDGQPSDVGERQAGQPRVPSGIDAEPGRGAPGRRGDGVVGEHDPLGVTRRARRRDDQRVALLDPDAVRKRVLFPVGADDPGRAQRVEHDLAGSEREPRVERSGGVAGVPDGPERIDKAHPTREVECDELRHRPVA